MDNPISYLARVARGEAGHTGKSKSIIEQRREPTRNTSFPHRPTTLAGKARRERRRKERV